MSTPDTPNGTVQVSTCGEASALHASRPDGLNLVSIGNLRVMIKPESPDLWVAQGLEIDYCADGTTLTDVQQAFADGLMLTIHENLRVFGSISPVLRAAPGETWHEFLTGAAEQQFTHSQDSVHRIAGMSLSFYVQKAA